MIISVIIPVLNEADTINSSVGHLRGLRKGSDIEIIVSEGDPSATTISRITDPEVVKVSSGKGRGRQMNRGAESASGDVLLFLHADTLLPQGAFEDIEGAMKKNLYAGGAFDLGIDSRNTAFRLIERAASLRSRLTRVPYGDQAIFIRSDIFKELGGFRELPIMEDVDLMLRTRRSGHKIYIVPHRVRTSPRRWEREGILRCTCRNWMLITMYSLGVSPDRLARFYE